MTGCIVVQGEEIWYKSETPEAWSPNGRQEQDQGKTHNQDK